MIAAQLHESEISPLRNELVRRFFFVVVQFCVAVFNLGVSAKKCVQVEIVIGFLLETKFGLLLIACSIYIYGECTVSLRYTLSAR